MDTLPLQVTTPVAVAADAAFLCIRAEGVRRLELDAEGGISDPERMMAMEEGQYALALGRGTLLTRKEPFLLAWDVADPRQPKLLGRTDVAMRTLSLVRHADYLYLAKSRMGGLQVLHAPILRGR